MAEPINLKSFSTITRRTERKVLVSIDGGYISIKIPDAQDYDISLSDIKTNKQLVQWIHHLTEKTWVTREIVHDVIDAAVFANKLPFYGENK